MTRYPTRGAGNSADGSGAMEALPRAYRIPEVCRATSLGRTSIYAAIKSGTLIARRYGRCTVVLAEDLIAFLNSLPKTR
jgi:Helix-turn-helix domain